MLMRFLTTIMVSLAAIAAFANDGICPDSILVFQHNDLEFAFELENAEGEASITWNFGDGTEVIAGADVTHVFAEGSYVITAILMDNDCPWDGPYVISTTIDVYPCWLNLSYVALKEGFYTFTATGYPEKYPMFWEMGDGTSIVETWVVDHQYAPGTYEVCAWITSDFCFVDTLEACVTFTYEITEGINENGVDLVELFPNPSTGLLRISGGSFERMIIHSPDGKVLEEKYLFDGVIDLSHRSDGIYLISLWNQGSTPVVKRVTILRP